MQKGAKTTWEPISGAVNGQRFLNARPLFDHRHEWYAIQTRYRFERRVATNLERKGLETFSPALREAHSWSDRQKVLQIPLFSGYTFARLDISSPARLAVLQTEGVLGFIKFGGEATPVPAKQIQSLRVLLSHDTPCSLRAFLREGQRVRIRGGSLHGIEGILEQNTEKYLVISIHAIERSIALRIEGYEVEPV